MFSVHTIVTYFDPNSKYYNNSQYDFCRNVLNNFDQAIKENFKGNISLQYESRTQFTFTDNQIKFEDFTGEVYIIYRSYTANEWVIIGFVPDITKLRLARILDAKPARRFDAKTEINMKVAAIHEGIPLKVERNKLDKITKITFDSSSTEHCFPKVELHYLWTSASKQSDVEELNSPVENLTIDDESIAPELNGGELFAVDIVERKKISEEKSKARFNQYRRPSDSEEEDPFRF
ncbi:hypothetical protein Q0590_36565 [Rhodocytophaga aerolata]|uniref:Uncharacterized protein n=1 Tax=Rhodocytophaga aerolata TaxID=455078 RepID=A0ABT8RJ86_9BACT|nr:hypothetical protein [Rhodocytophaga aerolata]MDO1451841.1 hypothetical protein [Rhodocytophaga aerolata]